MGHGVSSDKRRPQWRQKFASALRCKAKGWIKENAHQLSPRPPDNRTANGIKWVHLRMIKYGFSWSSVIRNHVKHVKRAVEPLGACAKFKTVQNKRLNKTCCWSHRSNDSRDSKDRAAKGQIEVTAVRASKLLLHSGKLKTTSAFQGCMRCEMLQQSEGQFALHSICRQWIVIETALLPEQKSRHVWFCKNCQICMKR